MSRLFLVSCGKSKLRVPACPAGSLYVGPLFLSASNFARLSGHPWLIVSAKHGLVSPDKILAPYERTLLNMTPEEIGSWKQMVREQLSPWLGHQLVVLASKSYEQVTEGVAGVEYPLRGLNLFQRLSWLGDMHNLRRYR